MKNNPHVRTSEENREDARVPVHILVERLRKEMDDLNAEKRQNEQNLATVEHWKRDELARIYSSRFPKSEACARTNRLECEYNQKRKPFLEQLYAIEERVHAIKGRLIDADKALIKSKYQDVAERESRKIAVLERIDSKLQHLIDLVMEIKQVKGGGDCCD